MGLLKVPFCADIMPNSLAMMVVCAHFHELFVAIKPIVFHNISLPRRNYEEENARDFPVCRKAKSIHSNISLLIIQANHVLVLLGKVEDNFYQHTLENRRLRIGFCNYFLKLWATFATKILLAANDKL
jgi:hypothetical protein